MSREDQQETERYRALCYLALDRTPEAELALEAMVRVDPVARPGAELPPRMRLLLMQVRQRVARVLARDGYERGRGYYQNGQLSEARNELATVIALLDDQDLRLAAEPAFADLRLLAEGFLMLASAVPGNAASGTRDGGSVARPAEPHAPASAPPASTAAALIVPPRPRQQPIPPFNASTAPGAVTARDGEIEVDVGPDGSVSAARMTVPIHPTYDALLMATAKRDWMYQPATRDGRPTSYMVRVRVVMGR